MFCTMKELLVGRRRYVIRELHIEATVVANAVAERGGFEPPRPLRVYALSKRAH